MGAIRIKVGASLEANATSVFVPLVRAAERARRDIAKSFDSAAKEPGKLTRANKASGDAVIRDVEREAAKLLAEETKGQKQRTREVQREVNERVRLEKQAMREIERELDQANREIARRQERSNRGGAIGIGRRAAISVSRGSAIAYGLAGRAISGAVGVGEDLLQGAGVDTTLAPHIQRAMDLRSRASQVVNAGYIPGSAGMQGVKQDPAEVMKDVESAANRTAFSMNEAMEGLQGFVAQTGDLQTGRDMLFDMAKLARATGSSLKDMSDAAAQVSNKLGDVPNKGEAVSAVMRVIAGQGKMGAVEVKDLARQMAKVAANARMFEGPAARNIGELGILAQEARLRGGAASASIAATSVTAFANTLSTPTTVLKHWGGMGLNPYTDQTYKTLRSPEEIILEALKKSGGNKIKLQELFPNIRAMASVRGFADVYNATGGTTEEKLRAVRAEFENLRHAQLDAEEVNRAFSQAMQTAESKVQIANNRLDQMAGKIADAMLPALAGLAPVIEDLTPLMAKFAENVATFLGYDPKADAEAKAKQTRDTQVEALRKEAENASFVGPLSPQQESTLGKKRDKGIDASHWEAVAESVAKVSGQRVMAEAKLRGDEEALAQHHVTSGAKDNWFTMLTGISMQHGDDAKKDIEKQRAHLEQLRQEEAKGREVLVQIRDAIRDGFYKANAPAPPPVKNDNSGRAPAEADHE
jgi:hypothetical protein